MLLRARRHPKLLSVVVCVVVVSVFLVWLGVWWSDGVPPSLPLPHQLHHHDILETTNVSSFIDGPRHLTLEPVKTLEACGRGAEVVVVVPSTPSNVEARSGVRESWGSYLPTTWTLVFYVGGVNRQSVQERLIGESQTHKDIAQDPTFPDSYATLTLKTIALLAWVQKACPSAKFILKADDDVFVNVPKLHALTRCLEIAMRSDYKQDLGSFGNTCSGARTLVSHYVDITSHRYEAYVLGGYLYQGVRPDRSESSKWRLEKSAYEKDVLPDYLSGTAYLLSENVLRHLLDTARKTKLIRLEDVYLTGLVASEGLKLRLSYIDGFERFRPRYEGPCVYDSLLTAHGFLPGEMRMTTHAALGLADGACDGWMTRLGLRVNAWLTKMFPRVPSSVITTVSDADVQAVI